MKIRLFAVSAFIFSAALGVVAEQSPLPIQDGETLPLWSGPAPGSLGGEESDIPAITAFLPFAMTENTPAIIIMTESWTNRASRNNLLGMNPDPELAMSLSGESAVTEGTPPTFIFQTDADRGVPAENSVYYYLALREAGIPAEMHIFEQGPHGVGLANDDFALSEWSKLLANWLRLRLVA